MDEIKETSEEIKKIKSNKTESEKKENGDFKEKIMIQKRMKLWKKKLLFIVNYLYEKLKDK